MNQLKQKIIEIRIAARKAYNSGKFPLFNFLRREAQALEEDYNWMMLERQLDKRTN